MNHDRNSHGGSVQSDGIAESAAVDNLTQPTSNVPPSLNVEIKRSLWQPIRDWLWGYDFFVSYHWSSGGVYAVNLAQMLRSKGFDVFLDRTDYASGDDWKRMGQIALRNTQRLVLVATREAVTISKPVQHEVEIFTARGRQVVPIIFGDRFTDIDRSDYPTLTRLPDSHLFVDSGADSLATGPTRETVDELIRTHKVLRKRNLRALLTLIPAIIVALFAAFATYQWGDALVAKQSALDAFEEEKKAKENEIKQRTKAETNYRIAEARRLSLESKTLSTEDRKAALNLSLQSMNQSLPLVGLLPDQLESFFQASRRIQGNSVGALHKNISAWAASHGKNLFAVASSSHAFVYTVSGRGFDEIGRHDCGFLVQSLVLDATGTHLLIRGSQNEKRLLAIGDVVRDQTPLPLQEREFDGVDLDASRNGLLAWSLDRQEVLFWDLTKSQHLPLLRLEYPIEQLFEASYSHQSNLLVMKLTRKEGDNEAKIGVLKVATSLTEPSPAVQWIPARDGTFFFTYFSSNGDAVLLDGPPLKISYLSKNVNAPRTDIEPRENGLDAPIVTDGLGRWFFSTHSGFAIYRADDAVLKLEVVHDYPKHIEDALFSGGALFIRTSDHWEAFNFDSKGIPVASTKASTGLRNSNDISSRIEMWPSDSGDLTYLKVNQSGREPTIFGQWDGKSSQAHELLYYPNTKFGLKRAETVGNSGLLLEEGDDDVRFVWTSPSAWHDRWVQRIDCPTLSSTRPQERILPSRQAFFGGLAFETTTLSPERSTTRLIVRAKDGENTCLSYEVKDFHAFESPVPLQKPRCLAVFSIDDSAQNAITVCEMDQHLGLVPLQTLKTDGPPSIVGASSTGKFVFGSCGKPQRFFLWERDRRGEYEQYDITDSVCTTNTSGISKVVIDEGNGIFVCLYSDGELVAWNAGKGIENPRTLIAGNKELSGHSDDINPFARALKQTFEQREPTLIISRCSKFLAVLDDRGGVHSFRLSKEGITKVGSQSLNVLRLCSFGKEHSLLGVMSDRIVELDFDQSRQELIIESELSKDFCCASVDGKWLFFKSGQLDGTVRLVNLDLPKDLRRIATLSLADSSWLGDSPKNASILSAWFTSDSKYFECVLEGGYVYHIPIAADSIVKESQQMLRIISDN